MDGWVGGQLDEQWVDEWMGGQVDGQMNEQMHRWVDTQVDIMDNHDLIII